MLKIFKSVDEKLAEIGFIKKGENNFYCEYERFNKAHNYVHKVSIRRRKSGNHILRSYDPALVVLRSYDPALFDTEKIGNTCVGLTEYEMKLFHKKMKKMFK